MLKTGLGATAVLTLLSTLLATILAERTATPIRQLTQVIQRTLEGDLHARLLLSHRDEMGELARAFNQLAEQQAEQLTQLTEEREQLASVLEYMADGVFILDELGIIQLINPAAARLVNSSPATALDRSFAEVVRHHQLIELSQLCRRQKREQTAAVEIGQQLFLQAVITPLKKQGSQTHYLVILQDLTPVRRLETIRRDFISNISHELRTPLASLRALVETLQDGALEDPPAAQRFLGRSLQEVDTLTQMVEELLELSRIESGQVPLQLKPTAVADLLLLPLERLRPQAERDQIALVLDLPGKLPSVLADAERIHRVVTNLVHNALKFTPAKGTVTVRAAVENSQEVAIMVQDTGIGIPEEHLSRIFERFYKLDQARTRSRGGTGLGLAISRHLVQAHNGRIWVKSQERKGSTFTFTLPTASSH